MQRGGIIGVGASHLHLPMSLHQIDRQTALPQRPDAPNHEPDPQLVNLYLETFPSRYRIFVPPAWFNSTNTDECGFGARPCAGHWRS